MPPGVHLPIMVREVVECLRPEAGDLAVDCTLGGGGHARAILARILPGGRLIGLDIDAVELPRTEASLRQAGFGTDALAVCTANFADLPRVLAGEQLAGADLIIADLGVSAMQFDSPGRGFNWRGVGPLDMRMDPMVGETAAQLIARASEDELAAILDENADEPHAVLIAQFLKQQPCESTHATERYVRTGLAERFPSLSKSEVKMSVRRTFQALRIAVNGELANLDALLRVLPQCLAPGGRAAIITFHSGEDRRVKQAFRAGHRDGVYSSVATSPVRSKKDETFSNRRAAAAKLRWAERAG